MSSDVHRGRVDFTDALQIVSTVPNEMGFSTRYQELHGIPRCAHEQCVFWVTQGNLLLPYVKVVSQHAY